MTGSRIILPPHPVIPDSQSGLLNQAVRTETITDELCLAVYDDYVQRKGFPPDIMRNRRNGIATRMLKTAKWPHQLEACAPDGLLFVTYRATHLDLPQSFADAIGLFDRTILNTWTARFRDLHTIAWVRFEVGSRRPSTGQLHLHALVPLAETAKGAHAVPFDGNYQTLVTYVSKPVFSPTNKILGGRYIIERHRARLEGTRLPRTKVRIGIPRDRLPA